MIKRLLAQDGVSVVALFRDDGEFLEGYGLLNRDQMRQLTSFAHDYKRLVQSNADQLSMFTGLNGWTPPKGWLVHGKDYTVCSVGNLVCMVENADANLTEVMFELTELASF
ncbi:MAG: DUF2173 family protein [Thiotrichales bacterium]